MATIDQARPRQENLDATPAQGGIIAGAHGAIYFAGAGRLVEMSWRIDYPHTHLYRGPEGQLVAESPVETGQDGADSIVLDPQVMLIGVAYPFRFLGQDLLVMKDVDGSLDFYCIREVEGSGNPEGVWTSGG